MDTLVKMQMLFGLRHIKVKEYFRLNSNNNILFFKDFIYLFLERGKGREKERQRNINVWLPLSCPLLGTWPKTQECVQTWIEPLPLWFTGQHPIHWAIPAKVVLHYEFFPLNTFLKLEILKCRLKTYFYNFDGKDITNFNTSTRH